MEQSALCTAIKKEATSGEYGIATISDIHLGGTSIPADTMVDALDHYLIHDVLAKIKVLFINGDLFDRGLRWTDPIIPMIEELVVNLLLACVSRGVALRILEGTPSHDRGQNAIFERFIKYLGLEDKLDFKYVDVVSIEYIKCINAHVLYVPDGEVDTDATFLKVKECMAEQGLEKVDHAMMHGTFDYQLPEVANTPKHNSANYLSIVKNIINSGHIHDAHVFKRIYGNGSFFYMEHGYDKPKGFWHYTVKGDKHVAEFIVNKRAPFFSTVDCRNLPIEESMSKINTLLESHTWLYGSSIRLWAEKDNLVIGQVSSLKRQYNQIRWMTKQESTARKTVDETTGETLSFTALEITPNTIATLVRDKLISRNIPPMTIERAMVIMDTVTNL